MRKKLLRKHLIIISLVCIILFPSSVNAAFFKNQNGVEMTQKEYEKMVQIFSEKRTDVLTQEEFENYKNSNIIENKSIFQKTVYKNGSVLYEEIVSEDEYNNSSNEINSCGPITRDSDSGYYETSYKRLNVSLLDNNPFQLIANLSWKQVPACKSYDVFAFRTQHFNYSSVTGTQYYYVGSTSTRIGYNSSSEGYKSLSNGAGFSMNLKDDSNITSYEMTLIAFLTISSYDYSTAAVYTSYQHAQNDLTRAQSMSYTISGGGLGNVVYYSDTSIRNTYDGMTGVHLSTPIA